MIVPAQEIVFDVEDRNLILAEIGRLLDEGRLSAGRNVDRFEQAFAQYVGVQHAVAVSSGTMALELIMLAMGVRGRTVIVPANTNFATFVAASRAGARVVLCDVDEVTLSPRVSDLTAVVTPETAVVIVVHMGGFISGEMPAIIDWCRERGIALIEDAAHAHGSVRGDRHAGTFGLAGAFSFFATKVLATGEGGMVVTNDASLAAEVRLYRNLGKASAWVSNHTRMGTNGRMSELAAVVGWQQLARLDEKVAARRQIADLYSEALVGVPGLLMLRPGHPYSGYKVVGQLAPDVDRSAFKASVADAGVQLAGEVYSEPLHHQPVLGEAYGHLTFPGAEASCARQICLPIYPTLDRERLDLVVRSVIERLAAVAGPA